MKIYLSGAMASCADTYRQAFYKAQLELEREGHIIINPARLPTGLEHEKYMPICLSMIDAADAVYMLYGWEDSEGAKVEKLYAEYNEKKIMREMRFLNEEV